MDLVMTSVLILALAAVVMYQLVLRVEKILNRTWGGTVMKKVFCLPAGGVYGASGDGGLFPTAGDHCGAAQRSHPLRILCAAVCGHQSGVLR